MAVPQYSHQPTLRQLLQSDAMAEAQVICGADLLDRPIVQVVTALTPPPRAGSLVVIKPTTLGSQDSELLPELAGVVVVNPYVPPAESTVGAGNSTSGSQM